MLTLYYSPTSPFVRKVLVTAIELGIDDQLDKVAGRAHPIDRSATLVEKNPLGQVPTLLLEDGTALYDSRVICEYLNAQAAGAIVPAGAERFRALTEQALGDGLLNAAVLVRYERVLRPEAARFAPWEDGQVAKIVSALDALEASVTDLGERIDIGTIAIGCGLGYLDFRLPELAWRTGRPVLAAWFERIAARPSFASTAPAE